MSLGSHCIGLYCEVHVEWRECWLLTSFKCEWVTFPFKLASTQIFIGSIRKPTIIPRGRLWTMSIWEGGTPIDELLQRPYLHRRKKRQVEEWVKNGQFWYDLVYGRPPRSLMGWKIILLVLQPILMVRMAIKGLELASLKPSNITHSIPF